ncbi:hypothetical protein Rsub_12707 [Raphidocelis subcapitata]|uniref:Uncharacterized protein n=1 Tax=Raphidocelis subcapitata TaxID=307507 RepID=A0A2V0PK86_9CHLO|nr:hypothetical protein Rsub_12707 [Raphidocelis subcapitata]|eukprot:GBG00222.1 hypothetical protein Rsub_12707 [Raphidocelis subcapitata]
MTDAQQLPIYPLPDPGAAFSRPAREEYGPYLDGRPLVIDNGSHTVKAGWAGEEGPRLEFRSQVTKARPRGGGAHQRVCVGDWGPGAKGWEFSKGAIRTPFEGGVVVNYEGQEALFDYAFDRLGIAGGRVDHPLVVTEPPLNPSAGRAALAELCFETYGAPALHLVDGGAAAFSMHRARGSLGNCGVAVVVGHSCTTVVPVINGRPAWHAALRCGAAGALLTDHLTQLLRLRHPSLPPGLLPEGAVEALKEAHCAVAGDYRTLLGEVAARPDTAGGHGVRIQLPLSRPVGPTAEEVAAQEARRAARVEESRRRGKEQAKLRRDKQLDEKRAYLQYMLGLKEQIAAAGGPAEVRELLAGGQFEDEAEVDRYVGEARGQIAALEAKAAAAAAAEAGGAEGGEHQQQQQQQQEGGPAAAGAEGAAPAAELYPLLGVPDAELDEAQRREKRRQAGAKASAEGRARAAARREERARALAERDAREDAALAADPAGYVAALRQRCAAAVARAEARRRRRLGLPGDARRGGSKRLDAEKRQRMKLLAQAAGGAKKKRGGGKAGGPGGKRGRGDDSEDDGFGADDADWEVYRQMHPESSDSEVEAAEEEELAWLTQRLQQVGASAPAGGDDIAAGPTGGVDAGAGGAEAAGGAFGDGDITGGPFAPLLPPLFQRGAAAPTAPGLPSAPGRAPSAPPAPSVATSARGTPEPSAAARGPTPDAAAAASAAGAARPSPAPAAAAGAGDDCMLLGVERFRVPEILMQPSLAGLDEAGLPELVEWCLRRVSAEERAACIEGGLLLLGGGGGFVGLPQRLEAELTSRLPYGQPMRVVAGPDPRLDEWRGAAHVAAALATFGGRGARGGADWGGALTRAEYEERGPDWVREYSGLPSYW